MTGPTSWGTKTTQSLPLASYCQPRSLQTWSFDRIGCTSWTLQRTDSLLEQGDSRRTLNRLIWHFSLQFCRICYLLRKLFQHQQYQGRTESIAETKSNYVWISLCLAVSLCKVDYLRLVLLTHACIINDLKNIFTRRWKERYVKRISENIQSNLIEDCLHSVNQETITLGTFSRTFRSLKVARGKSANVGY